MTKQPNPSDRPDEKLPPFEVNVAPVSHVRASDLKVLLDSFRAGSTEPLFIGEKNRPEAAVIPFAQFLRLAARDHADFVRREAAFGNEVGRRAGDGRPSLSLEEFAALTGDAFPSLLDDQSDGDDDD